MLDGSAATLAGEVMIQEKHRQHLGFDLPTGRLDNELADRGPDQ
jgi:hypothetical protein